MKYYKLCTKCNYFCRIEESDEYCSNCGTELIEECKNCGKKIDNPYAIYCKKCGTKYREQKNENNKNNF